MTTIYVGTNFLLNLCLQQEDYASAKEIFEAVRRKQLRICVPSIAIQEAYFKLRNDEYVRKELSYKMQQKVVFELRRRITYKTLYKKINSLPTYLQIISNRERKGMDTIIEKVYKYCEVIQQTVESHKVGILYRDELDIKHVPDAFIIAMITEHIQQSLLKERVYFITTDSQLRKEPKVHLHFKKLNCELFGSFDALIHRLRKNGTI